ncbi:response regulator [Aquibacillus albus]|uniref:Two-component system response regulator YesN n=1 Tax=Aquibacillus albus TaxID=1168171 RepID=A0ABS2N0L2_9BACI|nr:two-component system response regulator YesN [Aquibacillus albus]
MINIMLVDDEPIEREGLGLILRKKRSNVEIVAEAENGKQAVELALKYEPDLIFMDIKMPEFDGIVAVNKILDELPNTKCIMVSAYDTFEYAREAMKFGIKEYLLKPNKISEVLEAYDRMVDEIESERKKDMERIEKDNRLERVSSMVEMEFIVSLMMDYVHDFSAEDWHEWLNFDVKQGFVAVFSFESKRMQPDRAEKSEWYRVLKQALQAQHDHCLVGPLTGFQIPAFILVENEPIDNEMREAFARSMIHKVQNQLKGCRLFAGVGTVVSDLKHFSHSYEEAIYALELVHNHSSAAYMAYNHQLKEKRKELIPFEIEKELVEAVKKGDQQKGLQRFNAYYQLISKASDYKVAVIKKAMENLLVILTRTMRELGLEDDFPLSFEGLETSMQIKEATKKQLSQMTERLWEWRTNGVEGLLNQAKDYIDSNYYKQISLEEVADKVGLSSYYLSKLFKERYQVTFIDYLTNTRLQKAKELLLDGTIPLKEIALNIGYKDPNYFSRVFKKDTGFSPSEYRGKYQS